MTKTPVTYKETKLGVLEIREIEKIITENLALVQKYVFRNATTLDINQETLKKLHQLLTGNLFEQAGEYRKHNVELGDFKPPEYFKVPELMRNWQEDLKERIKHTKTKKDQVDNCAWLMNRLLWVHPFFDYNGRIARLVGELYLIKNNLPVIDFREVKRIDFVRAVQEATKTSSLNKLQTLIKENL